MNNVTLMGNLGQAPELKTSQNDKPYTTFSIATNDGYGDKKKTNWHNCIAFGKTAEIICQYVGKGDSLAVSGSIDYSEKDEKRYTNIQVNTFSFGKNDKSNNNSSKDNEPEPVAAGDDEDDLPF